MLLAAIIVALIVKAITAAGGQVDLRAMTAKQMSAMIMHCSQISHKKIVEETTETMPLMPTMLVTPLTTTHLKATRIIKTVKVRIFHHG